MSVHVYGPKQYANKHTTHNKRASDRDTEIQTKIKCAWISAILTLFLLCPVFIRLALHDDFKFMLTLHKSVEKNMRKLIQTQFLWFASLRAIDGAVCASPAAVSFELNTFWRALLTESPLYCAVAFEFSCANDLKHGTVIHEISTKEISTTWKYKQSS